jgi:hypothetical protein
MSAINAVNKLLKERKASNHTKEVIIQSIRNHRLHLTRLDIHPIVSLIATKFSNSQVYHDNSIEALLQSDALYASRLLLHSNNDDSGLLDDIKLKRKNYYDHKNKLRASKDMVPVESVAVNNEEVQANEEEAWLQAQDIDTESMQVSNDAAASPAAVFVPITRGLPVTSELQLTVNPDFADEFMESLLGSTVAAPIAATAVDNSVQESADAHIALEQLVKTMSNIESSNITGKKRADSNKQKDDKVVKKVSAMAAVQQLLAQATPFPFPMSPEVQNTKKRSYTSKTRINKSNTATEPVVSDVAPSVTRDNNHPPPPPPAVPLTVAPMISNMRRKINTADSARNFLQNIHSVDNVQITQTSGVSSATNISDDALKLQADELVGLLQANFN